MKRGADSKKKNETDFCYYTSLQAESEEQDVTPEVAAGDKEPSESALPSEPRPSVSTSRSGGSSHME
jgi:hypothetical protein